MKAVIQRVDSASVMVGPECVAEIGRGLLVLLGIRETDTERDADYIIRKIVNLRIFPDEFKSINTSIACVDGEILLVSQFTLYGDCSQGNRPSFVKAMSPDKARISYTEFVHKFKQAYPKTKTGIFAAHMKITLINDGPVTLILES